MHKIGSAQVFHAQDSEDEIHHGGAGSDVGVSGHSARFESSETEGVHVFFKRHAVLQSNGNGHGKTVQQAAVGGAFFERIDEDFSELSLGVFTCSEEEFLSSDAGFHGHSTAFCR